MENVPIYRAKRKDKEAYVKGFYWTNRTEHFIFSSFKNLIEIEVATLSINFPDMKDSEKNKIFASLLINNTNGRGGDIIKWNRLGDDEECMDAVIFYQRRVTLLNQTNVSVFDFMRTKILGIQT